jgi:DNA-binding beta-propeller fold protein YncE
MGFQADHPAEPIIHHSPSMWRPILHPILALAATALVSHAAAAAETPSGEHRYLYVAEPGIRDYLEYGGHGILVFDMDHDHQFVKRIPSGGVDAKGKPINVKGICASAATGRLYVSTLKAMISFDLTTEKILWERPYDGGCDRMSISPDGKVIYLPSLEGDHWHVVDALSGDVLAKIVPKSGAHNTVYGPDGREVYLAGLKSPLLTVAETKTHTAVRTVGPFSASIRPFTVNGAQSRVYVTINELLGFEIGDLQTGRKLDRIQVAGFEPGPVKRHGCPSHGIALTPDERELWLCDAFNQRMHVFDNTVSPPKQTVSIKVRDEPGWITFSIDGRTAYPSTGDVIDVATHKIIASLKDEEGRMVMSEKLLEIDFKDGHPVRAGNQFGVGQRRP